MTKARIDNPVLPKRAQSSQRHSGHTVDQATFTKIEKQGSL